MEDKTKTPKGSTTPIEPKKEGGKEEVKTLTQEQVDALVIKTKKETREKAEAEKNEAVKIAVEEAERIAKLSAEEREAELKRQNEEKMSEREKTIALKENRYEAIEILAKAKVPVDLVDLVVKDSKEDTIKATENFIEKFNSKVSETATDLLKGKPPKDFDDSSAKGKEIEVPTVF